MIKRLRSSPAALNACASYFAFVSTSLWGLLTIPLAVRYLEKAEIGLWAVVHAMLGYLLWMDLGIGAATGRLMADSVAADDREEIDRWWTATRVVLWIQGILVVVVGVTLAPFVVLWLNIDAEFLDTAKRLLFWGVIVTALSFPVRGSVGFLTAQNRFHWAPLMQGTVPWLNFAAFYFGLEAGWGLDAYLIALVVSQGMNWILCRCFILFGPYTPKWNSTGIKKERFRSLFKLSGNMAIVGLVGTVVKGLPALLLARLGGLSTVPVYNFTARAPRLGGNLVGRTYQSFYPGLQRLHVAGKREAFMERHLAVGRLTLSGSMCGAALVLILNPMIVHLIAADHYFAGMMANVWFAVTLITIPFAGLFQILLPISGTMGKAAPLAIVKLIGAIGLSIVSWSSFGLAGLAAVFAFLPLFDLVYAWRRGVKECGYSYSEISPPLLQFGALVIALTIAVGFYMSLVGGPPSILTLYSWKFEFPAPPALYAALTLFSLGLACCIFSAKKVLRRG